MLFALVSLLLGSTIFPAIHAAEPLSLSYTIRVEPARNEIWVTGTLQNVQRGEYLFFLPRNQGLPADAFIDQLSFQDDRGALRVEQSTLNQWQVTARSNTIRFVYRLIDTAPRFTQEAWGGSATTYNERMAFVSGSMAFIIPAQINPATPVHLEWRIPPAWNLVTPWSVDRRMVQAPSVYALLHNYYTVFQKGSMLTQRFSNLQLTLVWLGEDNINRYQDAIQASGKIINSALRFFGGKAPRDRLTLILRDSNNSFAFRASTESGTIEFNVRRGTTFEQIWRQHQHTFLALLAHEFFHTWDAREEERAAQFVDIPQWGDQTCWLREGFTEYFAQLVMMEAGFYDPTHFINLLEEKSRTAHQLNSSGHLNLISACDRFLTDHNAMSYAYNEGAALAFLVDMQLRISSQGRKSLPDLMRRFLQANQYKEKNNAAFEAAWRAYAPTTLGSITPMLQRSTPVQLGPALSELGVTHRSDIRGGLALWEADRQSAFVWYFQ